MTLRWKKWNDEGKLFSLVIPGLEQFLNLGNACAVSFVSFDYKKFSLNERGSWWFYSVRCSSVAGTIVFAGLEPGVGYSQDSDWQYHVGDGLVYRAQSTKLWHTNTAVFRVGRDICGLNGGWLSALEWVTLCIIRCMYLCIYACRLERRERRNKLRRGKRRGERGRKIFDRAMPEDRDKYKKSVLSANKVVNVHYVPIRCESG